MNSKFNLLIGFMVLILTVSCAQNTSTEVKVNIPSGIGASQVARILVDEGVISHSRPFAIYMRLTKDAQNIKSGVYSLKKGGSYSALRKVLTRGPNLYIRVSIPEGFSAEQIGARLAARGIIDDAQEFVDRVVERDLRGFLFPETYDFFPNEGIERAIDKMKARFENEFTEKYERRAAEIGMSRRDVVTLASIIEKEAQVAEERPIISDVFHRRLRRRMRLESCATVLFALGEHRSRLIYADLQIDSPYNTYRHIGLPPSPICSPGRDAIKAALYPEPTDFLFFLARDDGSHIFSKTYGEHLRNQKKLR